MTLNPSILMNIFFTQRAHLKSFSAILVLLILQACTSREIEESLPDLRPNYRESRSIDRLEIPPDLTQGTVQDKLNVSDSTQSLSEFSEQQAKSDEQIYRDSLKNIQTNGDANWLALNLPPEQTWQSLEDFWASLGIDLVRDDKSLGIMETAWLERIDGHPKVGFQGWISSLFGSGVEGVRDRYKVRLDYDGQKKISYVYLTHGQADEVEDKSTGKPVSQRDSASYVWTDGKRNPQLEVEMLRRLSVFFNQTKQSQQVIVEAKAKQQETSNKLSLTSLADGTPALQIHDDYQRAWILLGIAIDRSGYDISGQNRQSGQYRFASIKETESGFLFKSKKTEVEVYELGLAELGKNKQLAVLKSVDGLPVAPARAKQILEKISQEIRF